MCVDGFWLLWYGKTYARIRRPRDKRLPTVADRGKLGRIMAMSPGALRCKNGLDPSSDLREVLGGVGDAECARKGLL